MVAFRYDNGAVGSLYYSREIPSLLRGLRLSKLFGRDGHHHVRIERRSSCSCAGGACRGCCFPGSATSAATRRCIATSSRAIREGRAPEMSLERAIDDQRLMDQIYASVGLGTGREPQRYDIIIIGSGAGGGTMAHALAATGARILVLERGDFVPQEEENWSPEAVWKELPLPADDERWLDERRGRGVPAVHALQRRRQHEVLGQRALPAAPRGLPGGRARRRRLAGVADRLRHARAVLRPRRAAVPRARRSTASIRPSRRAGRIPYRAGSARRRGWRRSSSSCGAQGLHPSPLPLGVARRLRPLQAPATRFACRCTRRAKPTSAACGRRCARPNVTLWTNAFARAAAHRRRRAEGRGRRGRARRRDASASTAPLVVVSCGAVNSAALLLRSASDRASGRAGELVGARRPPLHGAPGDDDAGLRSAAEERHGVPEDGGDQRLLPARARARRYPLGQIQSQGRTDAVVVKARGAVVRALDSAVALCEWWVARAVDWLVMSEDLPRAENRVTVGPDGRIRLRYRPNNVARAHDGS